MPLGKPVSGSISSRFGKRADPVNEKKAIHEGVDIKSERGEHILATGGGKVIKAMKNGGYGNYVEIDHGNGYVTAYAHMQSYLVKKGDIVKQGQIIGQVGSTGRSTGPHLHYEIRLNEKPIDPEKFIKVADIAHIAKTKQKKK
jgi:murein DD-endopeptidase MepM/ murein hydrolase activator NlpD